MRYVQQLLISTMFPVSDLGPYLLRVFASSTATNTPVSAPVARRDEPPKPHFRTDNDSSNTLTLPDGRNLGYAQYGSLTGRPIFYLHGFPGSRLEAAGFDELGLELGARFIAVDRPGIGWSSPHPGRTLLDHPKDLEHLAKHLELDHYSVLVWRTYYSSECPRLFANTACWHCCIGNIRRWTTCPCLRGGTASRKAQVCFDCLRHGAA